MRARTIGLSLGFIGLALAVIQDAALITDRVAQLQQLAPEPAVSVAPGRPPAGAEMIGSEAQFRTASIRLGEREAQRIGAPVHDRKAFTQPWTLGIEERIVPRGSGVEQQWHLAERPGDSGDLRIDVAWGRHAPRRYGAATWVDASGRRVALRSRPTPKGVAINVPARLMEHSAYPAMVDPVVDTEQPLADVLVDDPSGNEFIRQVLAVGNEHWVFYDLQNTSYLSRHDANGAPLSTVPQVMVDSGSARAAVNGATVYVAWRVSAAILLQRYNLQAVALDPAPVAVLALKGNESFDLQQLVASPNTVVLTGEFHHGVGQPPSFGLPQRSVFLDAANLSVKGTAEVGFNQATPMIFDGTDFVKVHHNDLTPQFPNPRQTEMTRLSENGDVLATEIVSNENGAVGIAEVAGEILVANAVGGGVRLFNTTSTGTPVDIGDTNNPGPPGSQSGHVPMATAGTSLFLVNPGSQELAEITIANTTLTTIPTIHPSTALAFGQTLSVTQAGDALVAIREMPVNDSRIVGRFFPRAAPEKIELIGREALPSSVVDFDANTPRTLLAWRTFEETTSPDPLPQYAEAMLGRLMDGDSFLDTISFAETKQYWAGAVGPGWGVVREVLLPQGNLVHELLDADGQAVGPAEFAGFTVFPPDAAVAAHGSGHVRAVSTSFPGPGRTLSVAVFDAAGLEQATDDGSINGETPALACTNDGARNTLVTWITRTGPLVGIRAILVDDVAVGTAFSLHDGTDNIRSPSVVSYNGGWLVAWLEDRGGATFVFGRPYAADGAPTGPVVQLTTTTQAASPSLTDLKDGNHVALVWSGSAAGGAADIYASVLDSEMNVLNPTPILLVPGGLGATNPRLVTHSEGNSLLAYDRIRPDIRAAQAYVRGVSITLPDGDTCQGDVDCGSQNCVDGICCADACGTCATCTADGSGCEQQLNVAVDDCNGDFRCSGEGECLPVDGAECSNNDECASGFCVDGACCNRACDGSCEQCGTGACEALECDGYGCESSDDGRVCRGTCDDSSQCEPGFQCTADNACVPVVQVAPDEGDEGCGCEVVGRTAPSGRWSWLSLAGLVLYIRRRRVT